MPLGLNRTDLNSTNTSYRKGNPVTLPKNFGNPVTLPKSFGNPIPSSGTNANVVNWAPSPAHFGNIVGGGPNPNFLVQEDGVSLFVLEDGSGYIILENN